MTLFAKQFQPLASQSKIWFGTLKIFEKLTSHLSGTKT